MSEEGQAAEPVVPPGRLSKAARNEHRKLFGSMLNAVATAWLIAAVVAPALSVWRDQAVFGLAEIAVSATFVLVCWLFHVAARYVVRDLED